ncbi:MAG: STAS domain-containing protein [Actinomycetota bacterium]
MENLPRQPTGPWLGRHQDARLWFWKAYENHYDEMRTRLVADLSEDPEFGPILRATPPEQLEERSRTSHDLMRRALLDGEWQPYLAQLRADGMDYAKLGLSFPAWFRVLSAFRTHLLPHLVEEHRSDPQSLIAMLEVMEGLLDTAMATVGDAYLDTKEAIISAQGEAIRELANPVLQLRQGLLILPIIGVIDTQRAREITEHLLEAIRSRRARVVVIDITGVADVDSKVANHLVQTVEASRLMGARVIVTGLTAEVAQTLVALGADLSKLHTVGDLEGGIEEADRLLGYRLFRAEEELAGIAGG